jgi:NAD(P)H-dependent FMN reductase
MNIILIGGSNRRVSTSTQLLHYMKSRLLDKGVTAEVFDLRQKPVPFYSPDQNETDDPNTVDMLKQVLAADGIVLGNPEYHGSLSGVLKNALDFMSSAHFAGKPVLSASSSGGAVGVSSLTHMQTVVRNLHGINCSEWVSIGGEQRKFASDGSPEEGAVKLRVERALDELVRLCSLLRKTGDD